MQKHLDSGCTQCAATLQVWSDVVEVAGQESGMTPPPDTVHMAKSQFALSGPAQAHGIRLVFDSFLQPATAGVRGTASARQLLYETTEFSIDLRLMANQQPNVTFVIGQVLSRVRGTHPTTAIPVRLCSSEKSILETLTNQFGEFHLEFENGHDLHLAIGWDRKSAIVLPLSGTRPEKTGGRPNLC